MRFLRWGTLFLFVLAPRLMAQNLLQNAEFDHDLSGWTIDPTFITATWQAGDSGGREASGNARVVNSNPGGSGSGIYQCVAVMGGKTYELSARVFLPSSDA